MDDSPSPGIATDSALPGRAPPSPDDDTRTMALAARTSDKSGQIRLRHGECIAGRFYIVRLLGEGGMALVYEAMDTKLNERRALKFSKIGYSRWIPPEARNALQVTHNNICRIHEIHTAATDSGPADFISMEFVKGETLTARTRRAYIPHAEAVDIARQLCLGVEAAHNAKILHRDLKSNNVMLTSNRDGSLRVVITDFGLARALEPAVNASSHSVVGTPTYIAPECWNGAPATAQSDVYALGVVLFELITGKLPTSATLAPKSSGRVSHPRWEPIVSRCLQPDPAKRFASASLVLDAIERAFCRSHRQRWLTSAALIAAAVTPAVVYRDKIWPPPLVRLAVLPVQGSTGDPALDSIVRGSLFDLAGRLESLGATSHRVRVIPFAESSRSVAGSSPKTAVRLGATHALTTYVSREGKTLAVHATVADTHSGEVLRDFNGNFEGQDAAALSSSLAAVVTSAFHLSKTPPASIAPSAYPFYAAGLASLRLGDADVEPAIASFRKALSLDPNSPLAQSGLADALLKKFKAVNDPQWISEASVLARRAETLHPDSASVLLVLGRIEQLEGRPERAIERFRRAAELDPDSAETWIRTGQALQESGRDTEATAALRRAVQIDPQYYSPHMELGVIHFRAGRHSAAVDEFRIAAKLAPELPDAHARLGAGLIAIQKQKEAEQELRKSLALKETVTALNNLSVSLRYQGRDQEAVEVLERAIQMGDDGADIQLNLGNALRRTGHPREARKRFQRASELCRGTLLRDPRNAEARAQLAYCMVRLSPSSFSGDEALQAARLGATQYSVLFWAVMTLSALGRGKEALPLLSSASFEQVQDLRRQPDLAEFFRDPRLRALIDSQLAAKQQ